jgi:RNA-directed DNA polymerase
MPPGDASDKDQDRLLKDGSRKGSYVNQGFDFLGYGFRPRLVKNSRRGSLFWSFTPAVSQAALTAMRETIRKTNLRNRTQITLEDVANEINPLLRGWIEYYGRYCPSALYPVFRHVNRTLMAWALRKYKRLAGHRTRASTFLETISRENPRLFAHWRKGTIGAFA